MHDEHDVEYIVTGYPVSSVHRAGECSMFKYWYGIVPAQTSNINNAAAEISPLSQTCDGQDEFQFAS